MSLNLILFCAQALLIQTISSQYIGPYNPYDGPYGPFGGCAGPLAPLGYELPGPVGFNPSNGGSFAVSSSSPYAPSGITVFSENAIEGTLSVVGVLPFLGTVGLEAELPTVGAGTIAYGCGNGGVGITAEDYGYPGYPGYGPGYPGPGYPGPAYPGPGYPGPGYPGPGYPGYGPGYGYGCY